MSNQFLRDQLLTADGKMRRRLHNMSVDTDHCREVHKALKSLGIRYESPGFRGPAVAHVLIPSAKLAILMLGTTNTLARRRTFKNEWAGEGWLGTSLTSGQMERLIRTGALEEQLAEAIKERRKKPKKTR